MFTNGVITLTALVKTNPSYSNDIHTFIIYLLHLVGDIREEWCELTQSRYLSNGSFSYAKFSWLLLIMLCSLMLWLPWLHWLRQILLIVMIYILSSSICFIWWVISEKRCELTQSRYLCNGSFTWAKFFMIVVNNAEYVH